MNQALTCSEQNNYVCAVKKYRKLLDSNTLNSELTEAVRTSQINNVMALLSEQGEDWPAQKFADYCEYGIRLLKDSGREKGQQATIFYVRGMIGHHELGNYRRKKELIQMARAAMQVSNQWNKIDGDTSEEVRSVTVQWAKKAINTLE